MIRDLLKLSTIAITLYGVMSLAVPATAIACSVEEFKSHDFGELTDQMKVFRLDTMSEYEFEELKKKGGGRVKIAGISIGGSYASMKRQIREIKSASHFEFDEVTHKSWKQSMLSAEGLAAYIACLQSRQGFHIVTEAFDPKNFRVRVIWTPGGSAGAPSVPDHLNVTERSVSVLKTILGAEPWGKENRNLEAPLQRESLDEIAQITIKLDGRSYVHYIPAVMPIKTPQDTQDISCKCEEIDIFEAELYAPPHYPHPIMTLGGAHGESGYWPREGRNLGGCLKFALLSVEYTSNVCGRDSSCIALVKTTFPSSGSGTLLRSTPEKIEISKGYETSFNACGRNYRFTSLGAREHPDYKDHGVTYFYIQKVEFPH